jgi:hypothetical protein
MKIKLTFNGELYAADMSGSDLEVTMRVFGKLTKIRDQYIDGQYRMVQVAGSVELKAEVVADMALISLDEAEWLEKMAQQAARKEQVAEIMQTGSEESIAALWKNLYYHDIITGTIYKNGGFAYEPGSTEHGVVDYLAVGNECYRVYGDGNVQHYPARVE